MKEGDNDQGYDSPVTPSLTMFDSIDCNRSVPCLQRWHWNKGLIFSNSIEQRMQTYFTDNHELLYNIFSVNFLLCISKL